MASGRSQKALLAMICAVASALVLAAPVGALYLGEWGGAGSGEGQFNAPRGIVADSQSNVYVVDSGNSRVQKFNEAGQYLGQWGTPGGGPGQFSSPVGIAVDRGDFVYVADLGNHRVQKFNNVGVPIAEWPTGLRPGLGAPVGIAVDRSGDVFVADVSSSRIEKFSPGGELLLAWGGPGAGPGQFNAPSAVATDEAGDVFVADTGNHRVQKFTNEGAFVGAWGSPGKGPALFEDPVDVSIDPVGKVYVVDQVNDQIQKFSPTGEFLSLWGEPGSKPNHFDGPISVAISFSARTYVVDAGNNRIEAYGKIPAPIFGKTVNVVPSGTVRFKPPHGKVFRRIYSGVQIKVGSVVDTRRGNVQLTAAKNRSGVTQSADFKDGLFKVLQPKKRHPVTELKLTGALDCPRKARHGRHAGKKKSSRVGAAMSRRKRRSRRLWGSGKGNYRSRGAHGSASVRGTIWLTKDTCRGTLFKVRRGVVKVRDFTRHRTVRVRAGHSYFVPAR